MWIPTQERKRQVQYVTQESWNGLIEAITLNFSLKSFESIKLKKSTFWFDILSKSIVFALLCSKRSVLIRIFGQQFFVLILGIIWRPKGIFIESDSNLVNAVWLAISPNGKGENKVQFNMLHKCVVRCYLMLMFFNVRNIT